MEVVWERTSRGTSFPHTTTPSPPEGCGRALPPPAASMEPLCPNRRRTWPLSSRTNPISRPSSLPEAPSTERWTSTRCSGRRSTTQLRASYVRRLNPNPRRMPRPRIAAWRDAGSRSSGMPTRIVMDGRVGRVMFGFDGSDGTQSDLGVRHFGVFPVRRALLRRVGRRRGVASREARGAPRGERVARPRRGGFGSEAGSAGRGAGVRLSPCTAWPGALYFMTDGSDVTQSDLGVRHFGRRRIRTVTPVSTATQDPSRSASRSGGSGFRGRSMGCRTGAPPFG